MSINWLLCVLNRELSGEYVEPKEEEEEEEPLNYEPASQRDHSKDHRDQFEGTEQIEFSATPIKN